VRVAFILREFPSVSETFVLDQITGLLDRGHEVEIFAERPGRDVCAYSRDIEKYRLKEKVCYRPSMPVSFPIRAFKAIWLFFTNVGADSPILMDSLNILRHGREAWVLRLFYAALRFRGKGTYDIIHCHFGTLGLEGLWLRDKGVIDGKLIVSFRGVGLSWYLKKFGSHVYDDLFARGDLMLPASGNHARKLIELGCERSKILLHPEGIHLERFVCARPREGRAGKVCLLTVGRLVEKKGVEYSIRAAARLAERYPDLEYDLVGEGPLRKPLMRLAKDLGVSKNIIFHGSKPREDVIKHLMKAQVFIAASVTADDGDTEGAPSSSKEAIAAGLPIVATRHGGIAELVDNEVTGFLVDERDSEALADKVAYILDHEDVRERMGAAGRRVVGEKYDIDRLNDRLVEIYENISTVREKGGV
jgi:colanic acid/amylovoran biosynthesis glycosyltransferase